MRDWDQKVVTIFSNILAPANWEPEQESDQALSLCRSFVLINSQQRERVMLLSLTWGPRKAW